MIREVGFSIFKKFVLLVIYLPNFRFIFSELLRNWPVIITKWSVSHIIFTKNTQYQTTLKLEKCQDLTRVTISAWYKIIIKIYLAIIIYPLIWEMSLVQKSKTAYASNKERICKSTAVRSRKINKCSNLNTIFKKKIMKLHAWHSSLEYMAIKYQMLYNKRMSEEDRATLARSSS